MKKMFVGGALVALVTLVAVGCANQGPNDSEMRNYGAVQNAPAAGDANAPTPRSDVFMNDFQTNRVPVQPQDVIITGVSRGKAHTVPVRAASTPVAATLAPASVAASAPTSAPTLIPPAPANPLHALKRDGAVGSYNNWTNIFGYRRGELLYRPFVGENKSVDMSQRINNFLFECAGQSLAGTEHPAAVVVQAAVNPSLIWETDYHRQVAIYGAGGTKGGNKNTVNADDVSSGAATYIGQHLEHLCRLASQKSLAELVDDEGLLIAGTMNDWFKRDQAAPFDVVVLQVRVIIPKALQRSLMQRGVQAMQQPCCQCASPTPAPSRPAPKKPCSK